MHPSIYREFHISVAPTLKGTRHAEHVSGQEPKTYVLLRHVPTGQEFPFQLLGDKGNPEGNIEEQIMQRFPYSAAAAELRALYGYTRHTLKNGWDHAFGDRIYASLKKHSDTKGACFWVALVPNLPPVLYAAMNARAVRKLRRLPASAQLRDIIRAVHDGWLSAFKDVEPMTIPMPASQHQALTASGWPEHLAELSPLEFERLKEKAFFARLALGYMTEEEWTKLLMPLVDPA